MNEWMILAIILTKIWILWYPTLTLVRMLQACNLALERMRKMASILRQDQVFRFWFLNFRLFILFWNKTKLVTHRIYKEEEDTSYLYCVGRWQWISV